jgi:N6-L-threonylcarbamoyladenine synthase
MLILGIETSCDDTSVALVDCSENGCVVVAEKTASQIDLHKIYGGVVPELAGRLHAEAIVPLIEGVLKKSESEDSGLRTPDLIAVTAGPGLVTGLIVGVEAARTLSYAWNIPVVPVNHIDGHIHSVEIRLQQSDFGLQQPHSVPKSESRSLKSLIKFPALALVVSGGHTELVLLNDHGDYQIIGRTHDDAAGECFDKVAKLLELPYPGGPKISRLAENGRTDAIAFPRPMLHDKNYDFSFSGLKTSALYWLRDHKLSKSVIARSDPDQIGRATKQSQRITSEFVSKLESEPNEIASSVGRSSLLPRNDNVGIEDFCASFEQAIVDTLVGKTMKAAREYKPRSILLVGGVSANRKLRETLNTVIQSELPGTLFLPSVGGYSMDNGAMIAVAGYYKFLKQGATPWADLDVDPNWRVDQVFSR